MSRKLVIHLPASPKPRNRRAIDPILRKGGCHQKTRSAERAAEKRALREQLDKSPV